MSSNAAPLPPPPSPGLAPPIAQAPPEVRSAYMTRVYLHVLAGIAGFIGVTALLFTLPGGEIAGVGEVTLNVRITDAVLSTSWLLILGGFMVVSYLSQSITAKARTRGTQYAGYAALVAANALLFVTPLTMAAFADGIEGTNTIQTAAWISLLAFSGLSGVAITTSKDFSFLKGIVRWGMVLALVAIVAAVITGTALGTLFIVAMIGLAGAAILYETQQIYRSFPVGTEVPAAMVLFSSLALLFWYVLQLLMNR